MERQLVKNKPDSYRAVALAIACFAIFTPNYAQYQVSPLGVPIMEQFGLTASQFSSLFTAPMIPAIFLSLFSGLLIDKIGSKRVVGFGLAVSAAGCVLRVFAASYGTLMLASALTGFSACFLTVGAAKILGGYYTPEQVGAKMGVLLACSTIGMTAALATSALFPSLTIAFRVSAAFSTAACVVWLLGMKDPAPASPGDKTSTSMPSIGQCLRVAARSRDVWVVSFCLFFIMAGNVVVSSFTPTALATRGIGTVAAGTIAACITIGNLLGCFAGPVLVAKAGRPKPVLVAFALVGAMGIAFAWTVPSTALIAAAMVITGTAVGGMIPLLMALPMQLPDIGPLYAGTAGGILGTVQILGAILVPSYVITPVADGNFSLLFALGGVCLLCAGVLAFLLREPRKAQ